MGTTHRIRLEFRKLLAAHRYTGFVHTLSRVITGTRQPEAVDGGAFTFLH
jgi:hypothetical protein